MKSGHLLFLVTAIAVSGCGRKVAKLNELEGSAAGTIQKFLDLYEAQNPGITITNLPQVFSTTMELGRWHRSHPAFFELEFKKFGNYAGFTNSFYERYVRVPPFVTNRAFPKEPIFMNAQPFPDYHGHWGRMVVWREAPQYHRNNFVPEEQIQEAFRRAGVVIPKPTPMPKPPVPGDAPYPQHSLFTRTRLFFRDLAADYGPGRPFGDTLMWLCFGIPLAGVVVIVAWFVRRR
jgi:hypothetical protein